MSAFPLLDQLARRDEQDILREAMAYKPVAAFACYSGGDDSLAALHWSMTHVPGCEVVHFNTGIGIERTRIHVRETCARFGWKLHEIRAKEDCGQDYEEFVVAHGFPGPPQHNRMYQRLKERCAYKIVKRAKVGHRRNDRVMLLTGIRHDESARRSRYVGREVDKVRAQVWVNPLYWWPKSRFMAYIAEHNLPRNPVSEMLGMSGECLCGAFAHAGEKALIRIVDPATADRIEALEVRVKAAGHTWGWEERKPKGCRSAKEQPAGRLCVGCGK